MAHVSEARLAVNPLEILELRDPHGVLSVYVDADPRDRAAGRPAWVVAVENGLDDVRERVKAEGDRARRTAVFERLESLEPELAALLDSRTSGRGRVLFATVGGGRVHRVSLQMPLETRVSLGEIADLTPLMVALDRGRAAGLAVVSRAGAQVLEQLLGAVEEVATFSLEPDTSEWRELKGPAAANPALAQHGAPQHDLFERRLEEHRGRLLEEAASRLAHVASRRSWDRVVVAGDARLAHAVATELARDGRDIAIVDRTLHALSPAALGDALAPELEAMNARREARLAVRARDAALSGNAGAVGLADVLTALNDGRAGHLLFDERRRYAGARARDGRLLPEGIEPPGLAAAELVPERSLASRMVERALAIDARVTPLSGASADTLAEHEGIAALLRW